MGRVSALQCLDWDPWAIGITITTGVAFLDVLYTLKFTSSLAEKVGVPSRLRRLIGSYGAPISTPVR